MQQHIIKIGDIFYNIKINKYKTVCAELSFAKITLNRTVMISYEIFFIFIAMQLDFIAKIKKYMIKCRNSHYLELEVEY